MSWNQISNLFKGSSFNKPHLKNQMQATFALAAANDILGKIFGKEILLTVQPKYIKNGTLFIAVLDSPMLTEIRLKEQPIMAYINEQMSGPVVTRVSFLV